MSALGRLENKFATPYPLFYYLSVTKTVFIAAFYIEYVDTRNSEEKF